MGTYGITAYLLNTKNNNDNLAERMRNKLLDDCEKVLKQSLESPFGDSLGEKFPWGSNMNIANNGVLLMLGHRLTDKPKYKTAAYKHVNYLLGQNALNQSFITGFGSAPLYPHHRPSVALNAAPPGMLVGGPLNHLADPALKRAAEGKPPSMRYVDNMNSYASNEVTIYWNSPLYFLLALLDI
jgi:endoglucanase